MWISLKLFLEVVIKRKSNSWDVRTFKSSPEIRSSLQNNAMASVEFSLDKAEQKFVDLSGNQLPINLSEAFNWSKNNFGEFTYPKD